MNFNFENPEVMYLDVFPGLAQFPIPEEMKTKKWNKFDVKTLHCDVKKAVKANELTLTDVIELQEYVCKGMFYHNQFDQTNKTDKPTAVVFAGLTLAKTGYDYLDFVADRNKETRVSNGLVTFTKERLQAVFINEMVIGQAYWFVQKYVDIRTGYIQNQHHVLFMPASK